MATDWRIGSRTATMGTSLRALNHRSKLGCISPCRRDCFAEPVIGPAKGRTRWLAMTAHVVIARSAQRDEAISATRAAPHTEDISHRGSLIMMKKASRATLMAI